MLAKNHVLFGATCYVATGMLEPNLQVNQFGILAAMLSALLPDIDHPKSFIGRRFRIISIPISSVLGHRGFTHSALAVFGIMMLLVNYFHQLNYILIAVLIGYLSHILGDFMTKGGIPFLWPINIKFSLPIISFRTGSIIEFAFVCGLFRIHLES